MPKTLFQAAQKLAPAPMAALIYRLMARPARRAPNPSEAQVLAMARASTLHYDGFEMRRYDWGEEGLPTVLLIDRSGLPDPLQRAMSQTGTRHLLAISGLHVGLVGAFAYLSARGLLLLVPLPACWPARQRLALWLALPPAALYALMAGLTTSPRRALVMYAVTALALASRRWLGVWRVWTLALALVLLADRSAPGW